MNDFPVDIVYTWVDGSDNNWLDKKNKYLKKYNNLHASSDISGEKRFANKDELKFSLRSIEKFCPWVRNIYLITDNQKPLWLNNKNNNLIVVDHSEIFSNKQILPTFSSRAIEMKLHHIKDLSTNFLSLNDDFFIGRPAKKKDFFYKDGMPKLFMGKLQSKLKIKKQLKYSFFRRRAIHKYAVLNSRKLIFNKYNIIVNQNLPHTVKALNKNILFELEKEFSDAFKLTLKNKFRDPLDTWIISLHAYYLIAKNLNSSKYVYEINKRDYINKINLFMNNKLDYGFIRLTDSKEKIIKKLSLINKYKPLNFCLNDWDNADKNKDSIITNFLTNFYPKKSKYEQ